MARIFTSRAPSVQYYLGFLLLVFITSVVSLIIYIVSERQLLHGNKERKSVEQLQGEVSQNSVLLQKLHQLAALHGDNGTQKVPGPASWSKLKGTVHHQNKSSQILKTVHVLSDKMLARDRGAKQELKAGNTQTLNYNVHLFYYPWYGNPETDGKYLHWNHRYLPHWRKEEAQKWPLGTHVPPGDIGSNFYPALGPYSSADPVIVNKHMMQVQSSGAGEMIVDRSCMIWGVSLCFCLRVCACVCASTCV